MNILDQIVSVKRKEVAKAKNLRSNKQLESSVLFSRETNSLKASLQNKSSTGIIAEFKKASPSKGLINDRAEVGDIVRAYAEYGAAGISVLTDEEFFKGSLIDLETARKEVPFMPLLRKDFIIDEYQLLEAKASGADVILLIAACLSETKVKRLALFAKSLQLEVLLEIHDEDELGHICEPVDMVGVNNRDLKTFRVDVKRSVDLGKKIPEDKIRISESGISSIEAIRHLKTCGYQGFLIGETFMKEANPAIAFASFVEQLNQ